MLLWDDESSWFLDSQSYLMYINENKTQQQQIVELPFTARTQDLVLNVDFTKSPQVPVKVVNSLPSLSFHVEGMNETGGRKEGPVSSKTPHYHGA